MTIMRYHIRLPWVAIAALVGVLTMVGDASAMSPTSPAAGRSCCKSRGCGMACCERATVTTTETQTAPSGVEASRSSAVGARIAGLPVASCTCCSDDPAAPASRPETLTPEQGHAGAVHQHLESARLAASVPSRTSAFGLSLAPLLLNTTRLLI